MRIAIAEDSGILRDGLTALLHRRGHEVVAAVGNGTELLAAVDQQVAAGTACDVAVIDIRMPPTFTDEGLHTALELRARHPEHGVLLFSQYVETHFATELLRGDARAIGYLLKDRVADVTDFVEALERIAAGQTVLDPEVVSQLLRSSPERTALDRLTSREREVLELMALGRTNSAIARSLYLSAGAVEKNISSIFAKLDLPTDDAAHRRVLAVVRYLQQA